MPRNTIIDPLYGPIRLDEVALALIDTPEYQRLRRIKQLGMASMVYPGAVHTRFEHAVGAYHLSRTILAELGERGELGMCTERDLQLIRLANLLHDIAHAGYGSHALEDAGYPGACHEEAGEHFLTTGAIGKILREVGGDSFGAEIAALVRHGSSHVLQGLVSGDCDPDKLDYLRRDSYHAGLAAGYDQARLRCGLTIVTDPATGRHAVGLDHGVLPAYEQMLYAKSMMYRTVYYHPVVIAASTMLRALVVMAIAAGLVDLEEMRDWTDEEVFMALRIRSTRGRGVTDLRRRVADLVDRLLMRNLYTEVASLSREVAPEVPHGTLLDVEREIGERLRLAPGTVLLFVPHRPSMLATNLLVRMPDGTVENAQSLGLSTGFAMNQLRDPLMATAGRVHLFSAVPLTMSDEAFSELLAATVNDVVGRNSWKG